MTTTMRNEEKPDVEKIMQSIRADLAEAARQFPEPDATSSEPENNLYVSVRLMNERYAVKLPRVDGIKGALRRILFALLSTSFESITAFHIATTHAVNKIVKLLEGSHDELSGEILQKTRTRMDLLEEINVRLSRVEARLAQMETKTEKIPRAENDAP